MTSIIIETQDYLTDKVQQKTIDHVNPDASSANLVTFAQKTAALSKDSYLKTTRIDKIDCDSDVDTRTQRNIVWRYYDTATRTIDDINQPATLPLSTISTNREFNLQLKFPEIDFEDTSRIIIKNFSTTDTTLTDPYIRVFDNMVISNSSFNGMNVVYFRLNRIPQTVEFDTFIAANAKYLETNQHVTLVFEEG